MYYGLIAAAGPMNRLHGLREKRGEPILSINSMNFRPHGVVRRLTHTVSTHDLT